MRNLLKRKRRDIIREPIIYLIFAMLFMQLRGLYSAKDCQRVWVFARSPAERALTRLRQSCAVTQPGITLAMLNLNQ